MLDIFGDFGFVGGENRTADTYQDSQTCINFYPEVSPSPTSKSAVALLGCPGLIELAAAPGGGSPGNQATAWPRPSSVTNLPVRGMWVLPGAYQALVVIADTLYLATINSQGATQTPGSITLTSKGTLLTNTGPVVMRDNNAGGYAVIVDGTNGYTYNISTGAFAQITSPQFTSFGGATTVAFIDGWWVFSKPNSQTFYTNAPIYSTTFDATYFALKDGASDNLVALIDNKEELWLIGERTTEIWYNAGGQYFPFQRLAGTLQQFGCKAKYTFARLKAGAEDSLIWLGRSERGENIVLRTRGFTTEVVSTPAVSDAISSYTITDDAIAYSYEEDGHEFYVLIFPSADKTWVYDSTMPIEYAWHQRASYDPYAGMYHRHRSNCFMNFAGMRIVGDYQNGALYQMTRAAYTDAGWPIKCQRRSPFIWDKENRQRMQMASLQVEFAPGVGNTQYSYPAPVTNTTGYFANGVGFLNGPYAQASGNLTGIANGKTGTFSGWFRPITSTGQEDIISIVDQATGAARFVIAYNYSTGKFTAVGRNAATTVILNASTANSYTDTSVYYHVMMSWNLATSTVNIYIDDVSDCVVTTATNDTINYAAAFAFSVGYGSPIAPFSLYGDLSEVYFNQNYIDITSSANRALFANSDGFPMNLGTNGENPTGSSPILYLNNDAGSFGTNKGTGGNLTVTGSLVQADSPSGNVTDSAVIGEDPQAVLSISRDYGTTYGQPQNASIGKIGNFVNRCIWRKLGWTRGTVAQIEIIDPVKRDIVGTTLRAFGQ